MLSPRELSQRLNLTLQLTISRIAVSSPDAAGIRDLRNGVGKDLRLCHTNTPGCSKASPRGRCRHRWQGYWGGCGRYRDGARLGGIDQGDLGGTGARSHLLLERAVYLI